MLTLCFLSLTLLFAPACQREVLAPEQLAGTYTGFFRIENAPQNIAREGTVTLVLDSGRFSCSGNPNQVPAGGVGTFSLRGDALEFRHEGVMIPGAKPERVLQGRYVYSFDGQTLTFWREEDAVRYLYELTRD